MICLIVVCPFVLFLLIIVLYVLLILYIKLAMERKKMFQMLLSTPTTYCLTKKGLKISKGHSESVYRRRTYNTMIKRKKPRRQTFDLQNIHTFVFHRSLSCCSSLMFIFPCRDISFVFHRSVSCC
jgi:hypothetical protein